jgi:NADH-quinone oxidoreductase subunit G
VHLGLPNAAAARAELAALGAWRGARPAAPAVYSTSSATMVSTTGLSITGLPVAGPSATGPSATGTGTDVRLATWAQLVDAGRMQDGEPYLAGTARPTVARVAAATAVAAGAVDGDKVTVATTAGAITVPLEVTEMAEGVVWLPTNSSGAGVRTGLGAGHGSRVTLRRAE